MLGNLTQHVNSVHLKLKPYKCEYCDLLFSQKAKLKAHLELEKQKHELNAQLI